MNNYTTDGPVFIQSKKAAEMRNGGTLCDIRRHANGFLYSGGFRVAINEELLNSLSDTTVLQFTHIENGDVWTCTVRDFKQWSEPWLNGFEKQRKCEIAKMNHTIEGKRNDKKPRKNELHNVDTTPIPQYSQPTLWGGK